MVEETFEAPTPQEAFGLAKKKYGKFSQLKLLRAKHKLDKDGELYAEITVSVPQEDYLASIGIDEEAELIQEIEELKSGIEKMKALTGLSKPSNENIKKVLNLLEKKGIRREWLENKIKPMEGTSVVEDEKLLLSYLLEEIDEGLNIQKEEFSRRKILVMVGPTGVGKTTSIAKLSARYTQFADKNYKVGLINLDTWRSGAFEQLNYFSQLLGIEHKQAHNSDEFRKYIEEFSDYDIVLVDTAGISPHDTDRLIKTIEFLKSVRDKELSTTLVVSAGAKYSDIKDIYEHFSFINIESILVTKFDETKRVGDLISFLSETHIPVSYISTGQKVPQDLIPASKEMILEQFLEDFNE